MKMGAENPKSTIVLLSGGLDSYACLICTLEKYEVKLALTFDYGQRAAADEIEASAKMCRRHNVPHKVIELPFLKEISTSSLNNNADNINFKELGQKSADAVWVPNRNGLFLNIAACCCDSLGVDYIVFGANKEEAGTFSDNSVEFCRAADEFFKYSASSKPRIYAPLSGLEKFEIINLICAKGLGSASCADDGSARGAGGADDGEMTAGKGAVPADLSLIKSCYNASSGLKKHCGECESCRRLKDAILKSKNRDLIKLFF